QRLPQELEQLLVPACRHRAEQGLAALEVPVGRGGTDPHPTGQLVEAEVLGTLLRQKLACSRDERLLERAVVVAVSTRVARLHVPDSNIRPRGVLVTPVVGASGPAALCCAAARAGTAAPVPHRRPSGRPPASHRRTAGRSRPRLPAPAMRAGGRWVS